MICTEQEAQSKTCPHRPHYQPAFNHQSPFAGGSSTGGVSYPNCIGSACMCWVWVDMEDQRRYEHGVDARNLAGQGWVADTPADQARLDDPNNSLGVCVRCTPQTRRGTCGLIRSAP